MRQDSDGSQSTQLPPTLDDQRDAFVDLFFRVYRRLRGTGATFFRLSDDNDIGVLKFFQAMGRLYVHASDTEGVWVELMPAARRGAK